MRVPKRIAKAYLTVTRFAMSVTQIGDVHLGTRVIYKGREMYVSNGVAYPRWHLRETSPQTRDEVDSYVSATEDEFKKVLSLENIKNDATSWWRWYKTSWLSLDVARMSEGKQLSSIRILGKRRARGGRRMV